jgi:hypothetical protein
MPFVIRADEALAIQEDEAQLLAAIAQVSQRLYASLHLQQPYPVPQSESQPEEGLRVQMGRRVVYGQLADGTQRRELTANTLKVIVDAIQRPVSPGIDPEQYVGKVPNLEIRDQGQVLFREERDGTVTVNQIQLEIDGVKQESGTITDSITPSDEPLPLLTPAASDRAGDVALIAQQLLNPLNQEHPPYDAVAIGPYQIQQQGDQLSVLREDEVILIARQGVVVSDQVSQADWQAFQAIHERTRLNQLGEALSHTHSTTEEASAMTTPPALSVLERETARISDTPTRQVLQATTADWKQQLATGIKRGATWIAAQPEVLRNQRLAHAILDLFHRGYERTGEHHYRLGNYRLSFKGSNLYTLRDQQGELLQFQAVRRLGLGRQVKVISVSDRLSDFQRQDLLKLRQDLRVIPQGSLDVEANYTARTDRVEKIARTFLRNHARAHCWDKEGGQFKLEMGAGNLLRITDKRGRGVVFQRQEGEVFSKLGPQDFAHFERLAQRMQALQTNASISSIAPVKPQQMEIG